jgi:hypothetical protein
MAAIVGVVAAAMIIIHAAIWARGISAFCAEDNIHTQAQERGERLRLLLWYVKNLIKRAS